MTINGKHGMGMTEQVIGRFLLGESLPMRRLRSLIARLAASDAPVLIEGPTGSGKELVAEALHVGSGRPGAFVPLNVNALADGTFESSLFGHVRGAFTGAVHDVPGYLAEADRGTAFFDEISSLAVSTQAKLLRAIETRAFRPIGARCDCRSDFRLVTASNDNLIELVAEGRFRADLFHRIGALVVRVPALADHLEDLPVLARHFARRSGTGEAVPISDEAIERLIRHVWPGNVRELRNVVVFAAALADGPTVGIAEVSTALDIRASVAAPDDRAWKRHHIVSVLADCGGDIARVAERLGLHPSNVYRLMRRLGIEPPKRRRLPSGAYLTAAGARHASG
jgi:DNA-binding NtrC family response regulator